MSSHFQNRMLEIRGVVNPRDLFSCPDLRCKCGVCATCGQPMHSEIHQGRGRLGRSWRHNFVKGET